MAAGKVSSASHRRPQKRRLAFINQPEKHKSDQGSTYTAFKIILACLSIIIATSNCSSQQMDLAQQTVNNSSSSNSSEIFRTTGSEPASRLSGSDDEELARTLDRTNDDEFNMSFANSEPLVDARAETGQETAFEPGPLSVSAKRSREQEDKAPASGTDSDRQYFKVASSNQTAILMSGPTNQSQQEVGGASSDQVSTTILLINRPQTSYANHSLASDRSVSSRDLVGDFQGPNSTIMQSRLLGPIPLPSERYETSQLPPRGQLEAMDIQRTRPEVNSESKFHSKKKKKKKKKKKIHKENNLVGKTEIHHQQPEVKMISYSAINKARKPPDPRSTDRPPAAVRWQPNLDNAASQLTWSSIGPPNGPRETALHITNAPSYLGSQQLKLSSSPLIGGLQDLKLLAQQVRQRQRVQLISQHLAQPSKESFMFDASTLPSRFAQLFPTVLTNDLTPNELTASASDNPAVDDGRKEQIPDTADIRKRPETATYEEKQMRPFETLLSLADQQRTVQDESMATSSSQATNEFDTTMKHQQREPIVSGQEGSDSGLNSDSSTSHSSSSSASNSLDSGDSDSADLDQTQAQYGADNDGETISGQDPAASSPAESINPNDLKSSKERNTPRPSSTRTEHELLVGPFKSESEAPSTITLSGVVYQKSGASSPFIRGTLSKGDEAQTHFGQDQQRPSSAESASGNKNTKVYKQASSESAPSSTQTGLNPDKQWSTSDYNHLLQALPANAAGWSQLLANLRGSPTQVDPLGDAKNALASTLYPMESSIQAAIGSSGSRLASSPLNPMHLLSSLASSGVQLDDEMLALLEPPKSILASSASITSPFIVNSPSKPVKAPLSIAAQEQAPIWASKKGEQYYLGAHLSASESNNVGSAPVAAASSKHKEKSGPIIIVQKDVKPVKYHLLRAYLKLRRLLRPFEATYVFPNNSNTLLKRRNLHQLQKGQTQQLFSLPQLPNSDVQNSISKASQVQAQSHPLPAARSAKQSANNNSRSTKSTAS